MAVELSYIGPLLRPWSLDEIQALIRGPLVHITVRILMSDATKDASRRILLGRIAGAHGIRGAVLIKTFTAEPEGIADYGALEDSSGKRSFEIEIERVTQKGVIGRVNGIADRTQAEALKGIDLYVRRERTCRPRRRASSISRT